VAALAVVILVAFAALAVDKSMRRGDIGVFFGAGRALLEGRDPYAGGCVGVGFIYPPYFAVAMVPFAVAPRLVAAAAWFLLNFASLVLLFATALYLLERPAERLGPWLGGRLRRLAAGKLNGAVVATVALTAPLALDNIAFGTINLPVCALSLAGIYFALTARAALGGASLGAAVTPKFFAAPLWLYLLYRKKYAAAGWAVATVAALFVAPAAILGWGRNAALAASWYDTVIRPARGLAFVYGGAYNVSLTAAVYRLFRAWGVDDLDLIYRPFWNLNTLNWVFAAALFSPLAHFFLARRRRGGGAAGEEGVADALALSLFLVASLLLVPFVWANYYVAAVLPVMAVLYAFRGEVWGPARVASVALVVLFAVVFGVFTSTDLWGKGKEAFYHYGLVTAGGVSLYAAVVVALLAATRRKPGPAGPTSPPPGT
jgi:hypothetical protein